MDIKEMLCRPVFFKKNRVGRIYTGGALFSGFFGDNSKDGFEPEEWVVSSVKAINKVSKGEKEGVSETEDGYYFDDLLKEYRYELLGDRKEFGVLTKILDSAVRLPVQAHPDKEFSRKYFSSDYGKAESWVVLATRKDACIYFGFREKITKEKFSKAVEQSLTDKDAMVPLLNRVPVKTGDVYFVPAKTVHAIGAGCLMLEVQEPSDFTIQPEYFCADYKLTEEEMYIGLSKDTALDVFDYDTFGEPAILKGRRTPVIKEDTDEIKRETLISYNDTPCFSVERVTLNNNSVILTDAPAVYVVTSGEGKIKSGEYERKLKKGDYFFLPFSAMNKSEISAEKSLEFVICLPPQSK